MIRGVATGSNGSGHCKVNYAVYVKVIMPIYDEEIIFRITIYHVRRCIICCLDRLKRYCLLEKDVLIGIFIFTLCLNLSVA